MKVNPADTVDDPADSFEYDEHGCLVRFTPEAFDHFMRAHANPARVGEVLRRLQSYRVGFWTASDDPYVEGQRNLVRQFLVSSEARLQSPITQLALMRLSQKCENAVQRFHGERAQELRVSRWITF